MNRVLLLLVLLLPGMLAAQYNEVQIMLQQAQAYEARQQYDRANEVYGQLNDRFPGNADVLGRWVSNLLRTGKTQEADALLNANRAALPLGVWFPLRLQVLLKANDAATAKRETWDFLNNHNVAVDDYARIALLFEQYNLPDEAVRLYLAARQKSADDKRYALELARSYQSDAQYARALEELVLLVRSQPGYQNYAANQIAEILDADRRTLRDLERLCEHDSDDFIRELLAKGLVHLGETDRAFGIYETLQPDKLKRFADTQFVADNLDVALRAYRAYLPKADSPPQQADVRIALARVWQQLNRQDSARVYLMQVYNDDMLKQARWRNASRAPQLCREMLAHLAMSAADYPAAERYLSEAVQVTWAPDERKLAELQLVRLQVALGRYAEADGRMADLLANEPAGSPTDNAALFIRWFSYTLQGNSRADTLLNTMIIRNPGSEDAGDALGLTLLLLDVQDGKADLLEAVRLHELLQWGPAIDRLAALATATGNEHIALLAADWALESGDDARAAELYSRPFSNPDCDDYARLRLAQLATGEARSSAAAAFLTQRPSHVLSPLFRQML